MCGIRVVIDTSEESRGSVLADVLGEEMAASGMLVQEGRDIVDEAGDENEWALSRLLLDYAGHVNFNV